MSYPPYSVDTSTQGLPPVEQKQPPPQPDQYGYPTAPVPPQQPALSNIEDAPPPYFGGVIPLSVPPVVQQKTFPTTGPVLTQQPTHVVYSSGVNRKKIERMFIISLVITFVVTVCLCWSVLICSIPALICSILAHRAQKRGDERSSFIYYRYSLWFNNAAAVSFVISLSVFLYRVAVDFF